MKRKFAGLIAVIMLAALTVLLGGCGSSFTSGTWYMEDEDMYINLLEDGTAQIYEGSEDIVLPAEWTERDEGIKLILEYDSETETLDLEFDGKDTLTNEDMGLSFERGEKKEVPAFTLSELMNRTWVQEDTEYELTFYEDSWEIYDYDESEYIAEGTYELDKGKLTMTSEEDESYSPTLSQDRSTLTMDKEMVFQTEE